MQIQEQMIAEIAKEVVARLRIQMQLPERPAAKAVAPLLLRATAFLPRWTRPRAQRLRRRKKSRR